MSSLNPIAAYTRWLHTMWPAGTVEKLPVVHPDGSTNVPGVYVVGDLTGIPLLKFSADTGARIIGTLLKNRGQGSGDALDLIIVGAGVSGMAAALEAKQKNLRFEILEAAEPFSTIVNFPARKPIYTYPTEMTPAGDLQFRAQVKEALVDEIREQTKDIKPKNARAERITRKGDLLEVTVADGAPMRARAVVVAIGRSGNFRRLDVPGEDDGKVFNRLHDPKEYADKNVLVVGGGDSALETAIAVAECGGRVTLSYRKPEFSRPKPDNVDKLNRLMNDPHADVQVERPSSERVTTAVGGYMHADRKAGSIRLEMASRVKSIGEKSVVVAVKAGGDVTFQNDAVFAMIGREAPLDFFRKSGVAVHGDRTAKRWISLILFFAFSCWMYHWKKTGVIITGSPAIDSSLGVGDWWKKLGWFPYNTAALFDKIGWKDPKTVLGTIARSAQQPGFYYSLAYCLCVTIFGIDRVRRRRTPYVKWQTITLILVQCIPLFLLPYIVLPWMGQNMWFADGHALAKVADQLFERYDGIGVERAYWRAFGIVLAWPLFFWNVFTDKPMMAWLIISLVQTFIFIPAIVYLWGKGAYCGWICSCGALAETLGDRHRQKMPHGPFWNRLNMIGQVFLLFAFVLLVLKIVEWNTPAGGWHPDASGTWVNTPETTAHHAFTYLFHELPFLNYAWFVDLFWAGILGVGLYFWFSGRVWCRFACPLAALMHIYARFSQFRILADKKKCISCNVCTSVCHQGIDVMNFANKGLPMADPQCVRCSACVQMCPTGVLSFGRKSGKTDPAWLGASPVRMVELKVNGNSIRH